MSFQLIFALALPLMLLAPASANAEEPRPGTAISVHRDDPPTIVARVANPSVGGAPITFPAMASTASTAPGLWLVRDIQLATITVGAAEAKPEAGGCRAGTAGQYAQHCEGWKSAERVVERLRYLSLGAGAAASAVGMVTAVYGLFPIGITEPNTGIRVAPIVSFTGGGVQLKARF